MFIQFYALVYVTAAAPWTFASATYGRELPPRQIGSGPLGWKYVGCYSDNASARTLSETGKVGSQMTPSLCTSFCQGGGRLKFTGYNYAGMEFSNECYCDFNIQGTATKVNETECNLACVGDSKYTCGGARRISIYRDTIHGGGLPKNKASVKGGWRFEGCHTDTRDTPPGRTLSQRIVIPIEKVDIESCTAQCADQGFNITGLEYGQECWCGSRFLVDDSAAPLGDCSMACKGDPTELCGAADRLSVYIKNAV